ncbi:MAG: aminotransferase class I/II-fold pyridoxal phosphate-dependent enzyme [Crocinitomicaceae bacterium]
MNESAINTVNGIANYARSKKIVHQTTSAGMVDGMLLEVEGEKMVNFGSCSYLGLEFDERLKEAGKEAIDNYGTQFSASRAYLSIDLYEELENKLTQIFDAPVIVAPTTTLGHISAIPVIVEDTDAIIMDHQVHNSVQMAVGLLKSRNIHVEMVRHNRMDQLEQKIIQLRQKYNRIWYMADGIYSMYGDFSPVDEIVDLMEKYKELHYYVDDAHGMSCFGKKGQGSVLRNRKMHPKMILATSFAKAFATGGGVLVFPNQEIAQKVRNCGGPFNSSGPMQPASLGAAIACADLHLTGEIENYQQELNEKVLYTQLMLKKYGLPNVSEKQSPIFYVAAGLPKVAYHVIEKMKNSGHFLNIGIFPTVPIKNSGIRFTITRLHTFEEIQKMIADLAIHFYQTLEEEQFTIEKVCKAFKIEVPGIEIKDERVDKSSLKVESYTSIIDIPKDKWNNHLGQRGIYDWNGMNVIENSFKENQLKEDNWNFHYVSVVDSKGELVLQTFLSSGYMKDDMLSSKEISADIKSLRIDNPYFYTSKFLMVGSLITEGNHLYLNKNHEGHKKALALLFEEIEKIQKMTEATTLMIRDLPANDSEMDNLMVDNGYFKSDMPENYSVDISNWDGIESYRTQLSKRSKRHFKENVERYADCFLVDLDFKPSTSELKELYQLYANVFEKSDEISTFKIPYKFFEVLSQNEKWKIVTLRLKERPDQIVGMVCSYAGSQDYSGVLVGLDYQMNSKYCVYRQLINQLIVNAKNLSYNKVNFGFSAGIEKRKFGALPEQSVAYVQVNDNFKFEALISENRTNEKRKEKI